MEKLIVAKFGGSAIGIDGEGLPIIIERIKGLKEDSKIITVCSAPLTKIDGKKTSLTDVMLNLGNLASKGDSFSIEIIAQSYAKILEMVNQDYKEECCLSLIHI